MWDRHDVRDNHRDRDDGWDRTSAAEAGQVSANAIMSVTREMCSRKISTCRAGASADRCENATASTRSTAPRAGCLPTIGAFRVVAESDLHDGRDDHILARSLDISRREG